MAKAPGLMCVRQDNRRREYSAPSPHWRRDFWRGHRCGERTGVRGRSGLAGRPLTPRPLPRMGAHPDRLADRGGEGAGNSPPTVVMNTHASCVCVRKVGGITSPGYSMVHGSHAKARRREGARTTFDCFFSSLLFFSPPRLRVRHLNSAREQAPTFLTHAHAHSSGVSFSRPRPPVSGAAASGAFFSRP